MASLVAQVAIALRELDIAAPSALTDEATLRKIAALDRAGIMQSLKDAGISKLGHRMRLEQVLRESFAMAALDQIIPKAPVPSPAPPPAPPPPTSSAGDVNLCKAYYEVVPTNIKVRSSPSLNADVIAHRKKREIIECDAELNGWVRIAEPIEPYNKQGWMLPTERVGVGTLLLPFRPQGGWSKKATAVSTPLLSDGPRTLSESCAVKASLQNHAATLSSRRLCRFSLSRRLFSFFSFFLCFTSTSGASSSSAASSSSTSFTGAVRYEPPPAGSLRTARNMPQTHQVKSRKTTANPNAHFIAIAMSAASSCSRVIGALSAAESSPMRLLGNRSSVLLSSASLTSPHALEGN